MSHSLDVSKLNEIFEGLKENAHKLNSWENDRLEEWADRYERSDGKWTPTDNQLECIERMWVKI